MADKSLDSLVGSGVFVTETAVLGGAVAAGVSGDIIIVTPPAGQRINLTCLNVDGNSGRILQISVEFGNRLIVDSMGLKSAPNVTSETFNVGNTIVTPSVTIAQTVSGNIPALTGNVDEVLTISAGVATAYNIIYAYQFGV